MECLSKETIELSNVRNNVAFDSIFTSYYPRLVHFASEYVSHEWARELVQDSFVLFWEKCPPLLDELQLESYLYSIVKNNCLMHLRHEKVRESYARKKEEIYLQDQAYQSALEHLDPSDITLKEMESIIQNTLDLLSYRCRKVFVLSRDRGMKNREIAIHLGISVKAVEAHITKALKVFRVALKDFLG